MKTKQQNNETSGKKPGRPAKSGNSREIEVTDGNEEKNKC